MMIKALIFISVLITTSSLWGMVEATYLNVDYFCVDPERMVSIENNKNSLSFTISDSDKQSLCTVYFDINYSFKRELHYQAQAIITSNERLNFDDVFLALDSVNLSRVFATPIVIDDYNFAFYLNVPSITNSDNIKLYVSSRTGKAITLKSLEFVLRQDTSIKTKAHDRLLDVVLNNSYPSKSKTEFNKVESTFRELIINSDNEQWDLYIATRNLLSLSNLSHSFPLFEEIKSISGNENSVQQCELEFDVQQYGDTILIKIVGENNEAVGCSSFFIEQKKQDIDLVLKSEVIKKSVIDLRYYRGGNMWPILVALGGFLSEGKLLGFEYSNKQIDWVSFREFAFYEGENKIIDASHKSNFNGEKEVWICNNTASSGEAVALALKSSGAKLKGTKTAGLSTSNKKFIISDKNSVMLTYARLIGKDSIGVDSRYRVEPYIETDSSFCSRPAETMINGKN